MASSRIFVAEDDHYLRRSLVDALRDEGWDALGAGDGRELLAMLTAVSTRMLAAPDAIVVDVRMPGLGGLDVLRALRLAGWPQPVIVITAFGDPQLHASAADLGAAVVLDKPFDAEELVELVRVVLAQSRAYARRA